MLREPSCHDKGAGQECKQPLRLLERGERALGYRRHHSRERCCSDDSGTHLPTVGRGSPKDKQSCVQAAERRQQNQRTWQQVAVGMEASSKSNRKWESLVAAAAAGGGVGGAVAVAVAVVAMAMASVEIVAAEVVFIVVVPVRCGSSGRTRTCSSQRSIHDGYCRVVAVVLAAGGNSSCSCQTTLNPKP